MTEMNRVLFKRVLKKQRTGLLIYALSLFLFEVLLVWLYPSFKDSLSMMMQDLPPIFQRMFGGEQVAFATLSGYLTTGITHPMVIFLLAVYPLHTAVSAVAMEVSQGTGDLLFTRPINRWKVVGTYFFALFIGSIVLAAAMFFGFEVGFLLVQIEETIEHHYLFRTCVNSGALLLAIGGLTFFISLWSRDVSKSTAISGGFIAFMYVLEFLVPLWEGLERISPFFLYHYLDPGSILSGGGRWALDSLILFGVGLFFTALAMVLVERCDL